MKHITLSVMSLYRFLLHDPQLAPYHLPPPLLYSNVTISWEAPHIRIRPSNIVKCEDIPRPKTHTKSQEWLTASQDCPTTWCTHDSNSWSRCPLCTDKQIVQWTAHIVGGEVQRDWMSDQVQVSKYHALFYFKNWSYHYCCCWSS